MKKAIVFVLVVIIGLSAIVTTPNKSSADTAYVQEVWDIICSDSFSGHDIATDSDGSIFAAGSGYDDYETIKMDTNGNVVWDEVYGTDRSDSGQGIAIDDTGDVYVTGFSYGGIMLIKYSANGQLLWAQNAVEGKRIDIDSNGDVVIVGHGWSSAGGENTVIDKRDNNGTLIWRTSYDSGGHDFARDVAVNEAGIYVLTTSANELLKYDTDGNLIWSLPLSGMSSNSALALDSLGNIYVTGDPFTIKMDSDGTELWRIDQIGRDIAVDSYDNFYVTGNPWSLHAGLGTFKFSPDGDQIWQTPSKGIDEYIAVDESGNVFVLYSDCHVVKYQQLVSTSPNQPDNTSPSNGATGVSLTPTLTSSAFDDPDTGDTHYASQWQITTTAGDYSSPLFTTGDDLVNLTSIPILSGTLDYDTTYYWHVRYQDNHEAWSSYSEETSFTTEEAPNNPPNQPANTSPINEATDVSLTPNLVSSPFSDPDTGDTHAASQWQITTTSGDYSSPLFTTGDDLVNLTSIPILSGTLDYDTTYYWHVRYQDNNGAWSSYSTETSFITTSPNTPINPNVTIPLSCATVTFDNVTVEGTTACSTQHGNPYPTMPEGFRVRGQFVDVTTTATYDQPGVEVCIPYDPSEPNPQTLKLFHWEGGHWVDVTTDVDTGNHLVCGYVTSLSWFFIGGEWVWIDDATGVPVFPTWYIGIAAALGTGILAYVLRRRALGRKSEGV